MTLQTDVGTDVRTYGWPNGRGYNNIFEKRGDNNNHATTYYLIKYGSHLLLCNV